MNIDKDKQNQSEKILLAAYNCISSRGYANVSLRDIADEAGVALSQLSYYYKNKEGLFKEVIKMMTQKYLLEIDKCLKKESTPQARLNSLIIYFRDMLKYNSELFKLLCDFISMAIWSVSFRGLIINLFRELAAMIEKYILNNISMKGLEEYSSKSLSRMILGAMLGTAIQVLLDSEEDALPEALNSMHILFE
ncbi:MAG: AcrR family transcriptional regulator [Caloramator sp.]|jgi:AcrR family transcriptional regulator|uniref:TetR/AcrR family transcriptional regulator n=1 Tax=Caloramator sp. TaxID=1871330 RepID=UPI001D71D939|nr:TetR/AcrR family transcriptional regulator [Caloramator sp.]MBZ4664604.1 AcrR family transcriptional regulator [Caloramator sp.]